MKKIIFTISIVLILVMTSVVAFADEIIISIDSEDVVFDEVSGKPFINMDSRTLVPFRQTLEKYGAKVEWDNEKRIAIAVKDNKKVEIPIGTNYVIKNGEKLENDTISEIINGRTYLPIRKVIEAFGSEVEWDAGMNTVVITTTPIDKKAILLEAINKSNSWDNYDAKIIMDMSIPMPDESGNVQSIAMNMDMGATIFMNPMKMKMTANMNADYLGTKITQPIMEMYFMMDDNTITTYMGSYDATGVLTWEKITVEDESFKDLLKTNTNSNLDEKYIKDVKYFGKYQDDFGNTLLRVQYTMSGEIYNDLLGTYIEALSVSGNDSDVLAANMLKNIGDIKFIVYIDETTKEIVRYEYDLAPILSSIFNSTVGTEVMSAEDLEILKSLKSIIVMEVYNVNIADEFEIPKEALNAPEIKQVTE